MTAASVVVGLHIAMSWHCDRVYVRKVGECVEAGGEGRGMGDREWSVRKWQWSELWQRLGLCVCIAIKILSRNAPRFWAALRGFLINVLPLVVVVVVIAVVIVAVASAVAVVVVLLLPPGRRRRRRRRSC